MVKYLRQKGYSFPVVKKYLFPIRSENLDDKISLFSKPGLASAWYPIRAQFVSPGLQVKHFPAINCSKLEH